MDFTRLYQTTLLTEMPDIINNNFQAVSDYIDVFYDENQGIIISPVNTPGRVKGGTGEFVTLTVDNLIVKSQYTNLYENITTANYDYWVTYTGILTGDLRDACTSLWEVSTGYKYIDVEKPYYKIIPSFDNSTSVIFTYYAPKTDNQSQIVQFILDPSGVEDGYYRILVDPTTTPVTYLDITVDPSTTLSEQTKWVSLICVDYDASLGPTWEVYAYGVGTPTGAGGTGGGVTPAYVAGEIAAALVPYATTASVTTALIPYATNVSVGLALNPYATNASVNTTINALTSRHNYTETSLYTLTTRHNFTETSLNTLTSRVGIIDLSILSIRATYIPDASLSTNFNWSAGVLDVSIAGVSDIATLSYVNGSLNARDNSLNALTSRHNFTEASLNTLTTRHNFTESSLYTLTTRHNFTEASVYTLTERHNFTESSLYTLTTRHNFTESSLYALTERHNFTETSLGALTTTSLSFATNASVGLTLQSYATLAYTNASLNDLRAVPIKDTCLGGGLSWSGGTLYVDVSTIAGGVTLMYVDGSLIARDASIVSLFNKQRFTEASLYTLLGRHNFTETSLYTLTTRHNITETSLYTSSALYVWNASLSNDFNWNAGMLEVSVGGLTDVATLTYVDGSLATRDAAIAIRATNASVNTALTAYATNVSVNSAFSSNASLGLAFSQYTNVSLGLVGNIATNVSLGNISMLTYAHNTSIGRLDASMKQIYPLVFRLNSSIGAYATNASVNSAFLTNTSLGVNSALIAALNTSMGPGFGAYATNTSVNSAFLTNTSLGANSALLASLNTSVGAYATNASVNTAIANFSTNASVNTAFRTNASIGANSALLAALNTSIGNYATNASVNSAIANFATNSSVSGALGYYIKSASTGTTLYWSGGLLNVSTGTGYTTFAYVDGSLTNHQNQINSLSNRVTTLESSTGNATFAYVDGSLLARDASISKIFPLVFALNTSMGSGLSSYATNSSVNAAFVSNASIGLIDSSLRIIYPLVFKTNSSLGNLTQTKFDACIGYLNGRVSVIDASTFYWKPYVDGSLATRDGAISTLNSQVGTLNSQMTTITSRHNVTETSLSYVSTLTDANSASIGVINASLNNAFLLSSYVNTSEYYDGSLNRLNASLADALLISSYVESSTLLRAIYIPEVSLNDSYFKWTSGLLEPSVSGSGVSSLSTLTDASVKNLANNDYLKYDSSWGKWVNQTPIESSTVLRLSSLYDVSINDVSAYDYLRYDSSWGKWVNERTIEASVYYYTKTQVDASFALKADVNASLNNVAYLWSYVDSSSYAKATYISDASLSTTYFRWASGYLEVSAGSGDVTKAYVDGSLATRDAAIAIRATNASVNTAFITNVSLGLVGTATTTLSALTDVSIKSVANNNLLQYDSSFAKWMNVAPVDACSYFYTKSQVDASFALIVNVNSSLATIHAKDNAQDASIARLDSSLNNAFLLSSYVNTSEYYDGSLNRLNASLGDVLNISAYVESSTLLRAIYIPEVSLNDSYFKWTSGLLEPSVAGVTSVSTLTDVSITNLTNNDFLKYDSASGKWINEGSEDISTYFYTKSQVDASFVSTTKKTFQTLTIVDVSTDWNINIGYNAKVTLTKDISLNILNLINGDSGTLVVRQDGTGSRLITLPIGSVKNGAWTLSTDANSIDVISFLYDGSYYWNKGGPYT